MNVSNVDIYIIYINTSLPPVSVEFTNLLWSCIDKCKLHPLCTASFQVSIILNFTNWKRSPHFTNNISSFLKTSIWVSSPAIIRFRFQNNWSFGLSYRIDASGVCINNGYKYQSINTLINCINLNIIRIKCCFLLNKHYCPSWNSLLLYTSGIEIARLCLNNKAATTCNFSHKKQNHLRGATYIKGQVLLHSTV